MEVVTPQEEIVEVIKKFGGSAFSKCYQCGMCDTVCPWNRVGNFSMRKLVREAALGLTEIENEDIWRCTTCGKCPIVCPRDVKQVESGMALRRIATEFDTFAGAAAPIPGIAANLRAEGNPFGEPRDKRADWANSLGVKNFDEEMEYLYSPGCYLSYDPRAKRIATATVQLLQAAGVSFGILGKAESCCGESIRKTGDEALFKSLARQNIASFVTRGVKKVLVSSPHCYQSFKNEYPEFSAHFEVVHISELLFQLLREGRLTLKKPLGKSVTFHDPCYLGRHNGIFDQPREALKYVPDLELRELPESRMNSFCCGGGGGRIWMETPKEERFSNVRLAQAVDTGATILATCCPYCITNFEDSRLSLPEGGAEIEIRDITEIIRDAL